MFNIQLKRDITQQESFYMLFKHKLYLNVRKLELDENKRKDVVMLKRRNKRNERNRKKSIIRMQLFSSRI